MTLWCAQRGMCSRVLCKVYSISVCSCRHSRKQGQNAVSTIASKNQRHLRGCKLLVAGVGAAYSCHHGRYLPAYRYSCSRGSLPQVAEANDGADCRTNWPGNREKKRNNRRICAVFAVLKSVQQTAAITASKKPAH